jgi:hypothetical protein
MSRGRVSCDIRLPSNKTPGFISSIRSRCYIKGRTLQWWNEAATMPKVSPRRRSLLSALRSSCSFGWSSSMTLYDQLSFQDISTYPVKWGRRSLPLCR